MWQSLSGRPQYLNDDGVMFFFKMGLDAGETSTFAGILGFFHRPIHASAFPTQYGTITPPVTWTEYDNLESWVEALKYSQRNQSSIIVYYDDTITINYNSWSAVAKPPGGPARHAPPEQRYGKAWEINPVYALEW